MLLTPEPAAAQDGLYGNWKSLGTSQGYTSKDDNKEGQFSLTTAIGRDPGFDNDGKVTQNIALTAGSVTKSFPVDFTTIGNVTKDDSGNVVDSEPLNPGGVSVSLVKSNASTVLPDARIDQVVGLDVFAKDQFGNLVQDTVSVTNDDPASDVTDGNVQSNFAGKTPAVTATTDTPDHHVTVTAAWKSETNTWTDGNTATTAFDPARKTVDDNKTDTGSSQAINWYTVDFAKSSFKFTSDPNGGTVPVGTPVHQNITVLDQKGQPIDGLETKFVRSGPNDQNGDYNDGEVTGQNGKANYDWVGTSAGVATVSAFVYDTWDSSPLDDSQHNMYPGAPTGDLVKKFTAAPITFAHPVVKQHIAAGLSLGNTKYGNDIAKVTAPAIARGATVKLYKVTADGKRHLVTTKTANSAGDATFTVKDVNGKKYTKYIAYVGSTARTFADWTVSKSIR